MRPTFSIIFLTTLIGAGQGLFLALYSGELFSAFRLLPAQDSLSFYALGSLYALVLLIAGLASSFFHLGRPERAWRAGGHCPAGIHGGSRFLGFDPLHRLEPGAVHLSLHLRDKPVACRGCFYDRIVFRTFPVYGHDLCLYQDVAGMGYAIDRGQLHSVW